MNIEDLLEQAQHGNGSNWLSKSELLEFCDFFIAKGFGLQLMEVKRAPGGKVARSIAYGLYGGDGAENWKNHRDPARSIVLLHEKLKLAEEDGADLLYKVWIDVP